MYEFYFGSVNLYSFAITKSLFYFQLIFAIVPGENTQTPSQCLTRNTMRRRKCKFSFTINYLQGHSGALATFIQPNLSIRCSSYKKNRLCFYSKFTPLFINTRYYNKYAHFAIISHFFQVYLHCFKTFRRCKFCFYITLYGVLYNNFIIFFHDF